MISRNLYAPLRELARHYPVATVTGPRQSGKTTLCRAAFPDKTYVSLEPLDTRSAAIDDPRGFLAEHRSGAIIDEVQHAPDLLSYLQDEVDTNSAPGRFVLTGSQHFGLSHMISQSLAGRTGVLQLLPPSLDELTRFANAPEALLSTLLSGAFPRIHDRGIPAGRWLADYVTTYVQRDVRQVVNVGSLSAFTDFLRLCAGRTACEVNLSRIGSDAGVSHNTARAWISVLETSFIVFRAPAWHRNLKKQMIKAPKLHFFDSGLVCHLLGIQTAEQLRHHPLRGAIFESWVASEIYKAVAHRGLVPRLYHVRSARGMEVDTLLDMGDSIALVEAKSGATVNRDFFQGISEVATLLNTSEGTQKISCYIAYGGDAAQQRHDVNVLPWRNIQRGVWSGGMTPRSATWESSGEDGGGRQGANSPPSDG